MKTTNHARNQIAAAILSFVSLVGVAAIAPTASATGEPQSFIGTTPNTSIVDTQPDTF